MGQFSSSYRHPVTFSIGFEKTSIQVCVCVCVCARARVRACMRACVCVLVSACICEGVYVCTRTWMEGAISPQRIPHINPPVLNYLRFPYVRRATSRRNKPVYVWPQQCDVNQRTRRIQLSKNNEEKEKKREAGNEETKERNDEIIKTGQTMEEQRKHGMCEGD